MSQFSDSTNLALVKRLAGGLTSSERLLVLSGALREAIVKSQEDYARELVRAIPELIKPDGNPKHAGDREYFDEVERIDREFCFALMYAYPKGSIRRKDPQDTEKPSLMGIRGDILKRLSFKWGQNFDDFGKAIFRFLWEAIMPGRDHVELLSAEKEMVLGILRERLKHTGDFNERVTRAWLTELREYLQKDSPASLWGYELAHLLAIARVRNDSRNLFVDIELRNENDRKMGVSL